MLLPDREYQEEEEKFVKSWLLKDLIYLLWLWSIFACLRVMFTDSLMMILSPYGSSSSNSPSYWGLRDKNSIFLCCKKKKDGLTTFSLHRWRLFVLRQQVVCFSLTGGARGHGITGAWRSSWCKGKPQRRCLLPWHNEIIAWEKKLISFSLQNI